MVRARRFERYSSEFKRQAVTRACVDGGTNESVCEELGTLLSLGL